MYTFEYQNEKYVFLDELVEEYNKNIKDLKLKDRRIRPTTVSKLAHCLGAETEELHLGKNLRLVVRENAVIIYMNQLNQYPDKHNHAYYESRSALLAKSIRSLDQDAVVPFQPSDTPLSSRFRSTTEFSKPVVLDLPKTTKKVRQKKSKTATPKVMVQAPAEEIQALLARIKHRNELNQKDYQKISKLEEKLHLQLTSLGTKLEAVSLAA